MLDDGLAQVRRNAVYLFFGVVVANLASFLFRVIIAREFGPEGFGVFSLALMTTSFGTMIALLGLPDGLVTFVSKLREQDDYEQVAGVVISSFILSIGTAAVFSVCVIFLAPFLAIQVFNAPALVDVLWWFAWIIPANVAIDLSAAYFLGIERGGFNTIIKQVIPKVVLLLLVLVVAVLDGPIVAIGIAYLVATGIGAIVGIGAVVFFFPFSRIDGMSVDLRELLTYSVPLLAATALGFFLNWTDTVVIGYALGSTDVGIYQSAFLLGANIPLVLSSISGSLYPNFGTQLVNEDTNAIRQRFTEGTRWALLISAAPTIYLIGFSELSLGMLFGESFRAGAGALAIVVAGNGLMILFGPSTNLLKAAEESRYVAITYGATALLNLVLNIILVPIIGLIGAALATAAATLLGNGLHFHRVQHHVEIHLPIAPLSRSLIAGVIAYLPSIYLVQYVNSVSVFGIHITIFSILYGVGLIIVGGVKKDELYPIFAYLI